MNQKILQKKLNYNDITIKIRIIRALGDVKPFGTYKNFFMIKILRSMKRPNVIDNKIIWRFMDEHFPEKEYQKMYEECFERVSFQKTISEMSNAVTI